MALVNCPECHKSVSDQAISCPQCGHPFRSATPYGYNYKSKTTIGGWPLVHIATGMDMKTGRKQIAKGIIAIGDIAVGAVALGGISIGGLSLGGMALGVLLALGGLAVGHVAIGGMAIGSYACGGGAMGTHIISAERQDPEAIEFFTRYLGESATRSFQSRH